MNQTPHHTAQYVDPVTRAPFNPDRDIAYQFPSMILDAVVAFLPDKRLPWMQEWMDTYGITEQEVAEACWKYVAAMALVIQEHDHDQALAHVAFPSLRKEVQAMIHGQVGYSTLQAYYTAVKEVSTPESSAPVAVQQCFDNMVDYIQKSEHLKDLRSEIQKYIDSLPSDNE